MVCVRNAARRVKKKPNKSMKNNTINKNKFIMILIIT